MRCPNDNETLVMADRGGVEIDYCPKCRGVWLDRGELDKIIDRAAAAPAAAPAVALVQPGQPPAAAPRAMEQPYRDQSGRDQSGRDQSGREPAPRRRDDDDDDDRHRKPYRKREGFLSELFDF